MYKLLAVDLDGTLLNSYGEISDENKEKIQEAINKNVEIVFASGRPIASVKNFAKELEGNKYIICGNGAVIYNLQNEQILFNRYIEKNKLLKLIQICEENSIFYTVYTKDTILTKSLNYDILFFNQENATKPENRKTSITIVTNMKEYIENRKEEDYLKIAVCDYDKTVFNGIIRKLKNVENIEVLDVTHVSKREIKDGTDRIALEYYYSEITNGNVNKWEAIENLINVLGIKKEEVIAIGDNVNDVEMIQNAGLGVIMGNADPNIKSVANIVTKSNDDNGVASIIENYILKE